MSINTRPSIPPLHSGDIVLRPGGSEYLRWTVYGVPETPPLRSFSVSFDHAETWHEVVLEGGEVRLLVAHPTSTNPDAVKLRMGVNNLLVKFDDRPETVVRQGGRVRCVS